MIIKEKGGENKYKYIYVYVRNCFVDSSRNDVPNFVGTIVAAVSFMLFIRPFCFSSKKKRKKQTSKQKQKQYFFLPFLLSVLANVNYFFPKIVHPNRRRLDFPVSSRLLRSVAHRRLRGCASNASRSPGKEIKMKQRRLGER